MIFHFYLSKDIISQRDILVRNNQGSKSLFMERNLASMLFGKHINLSGLFCAVYSQF